MLMRQLEGSGWEDDLAGCGKRGLYKSRVGCGGIECLNDS